MSMARYKLMDTPRVCSLFATVTFMLSLRPCALQIGDRMPRYMRLRLQTDHATYSGCRFKQKDLQ